jgi:hypothetical protein
MERRGGGRGGGSEGGGLRECIVCVGVDVCVSYEYTYGARPCSSTIAFALNSFRKGFCEAEHKAKKIEGIKNAHKKNG